MNPVTSALQKISGLDTIRFIAASFVVFGHFGPPLPEWLGPDSAGFVRIMRGVVGCLFNGPAAVIVFFVVSGFCIHYPQSGGKTLEVSSYLVRRLIRIGLPALVAIIWSFLAGVRLEAPYFGVFWSILCEIIYYLAYPVLLPISRRVGWSVMVMASFLVCIALWWAYADAMLAAQGAYTSFGYFTWVNGLPCWLLGCWVAQSPLKSVSVQTVWLARTAVFVSSVLLRISKFHVHSIFTSDSITLNVFAFLVAIWLRYEVCYQKQQPTLSQLEAMGQWSYSIYLVHPIVPPMLAMVFTWSSLREFGPWLLIVSSSYVLAYLFYRLVERPSHQLAQRLGRRRVVS